MILSKIDMFRLDDGATTSEVLDLGKHGDDIMHQLYFSVQAEVLGEGNIQWQTSDTGEPDTFTVIATWPVSEVAGAGFALENECLPKGLKQFNKLVVPERGKGVIAFLHDGRNAGTPFKG